MAVEITILGGKPVTREMAVGEVVECVWFRRRPGSVLIPGRVGITEKGVRAVDEAAEEDPTLEDESFILKPGQSVRIAYTDQHPTETYAIREPFS